MDIRFDASNLKKYNKNLEKIRTQVTPKAVRNTLNDVAFNTKKRIPLVAQQEFTVRNKGLFRAFILVNKVNSNNIDTMQSEVGIFNRNEKTAEGLAKQETGGTAERSMIGMDQARVSGSVAKKIRAGNYLNKINLPSSRSKGSGTGFVMIQKNGEGTLFKTSGKKKQKLTPLYTFKRNRRVQVKKKPFIKLSADLEARKMNAIYIKNANYLIRKLK